MIVETASEHERRSSRRGRKPKLIRAVARDRIERRKHGLDCGLALRGAKSVSWPSSGIGVKADTDRAFANRVVARDRIEHRKQRLDRRLALYSRNHEALFEVGSEVSRQIASTRLVSGRGDRQRIMAGRLRSCFNSRNDVTYELARDLLFDLLHGTLVRLLVRTPPENGRTMPETSAGEMIVGHFDHVIWLHGLPFGRPLCRPPARTAWSIPRKAPIISYCFKFVRERRLVLGLDAGRKSDMMKQAFVVIQSEENGSDNLAALLKVLAVTKTADYAVRASVPLYLLHAVPVPA